MVQLPNYKATLERTIQLVKPGGWLIIEDVDNGIYRDDSELGPGLSRALAAWTDGLKQQGVDHMASREYESLLRGSEMFREIEVRKVPVPVTSLTDGECEGFLPTYTT
jgi:hypothetical protein